MKNTKNTKINVAKRTLDDAVEEYFSNLLNRESLLVELNKLSASVESLRRRCQPEVANAEVDLQLKVGKPQEQ